MCEVQCRQKETICALKASQSARQNGGEGNILPGEKWEQAEVVRWCSEWHGRSEAGVAVQPEVLLESSPSVIKKLKVLFLCWCL